MVEECAENEKSASSRKCKELMSDELSRLSHDTFVHFNDPLLCTFNLVTGYTSENNSPFKKSIVHSLAFGPRVRALRAMISREWRIIFERRGVGKGKVGVLLHSASAFMFMHLSISYSS
jgi:hypothetical protein